MQKIPTLFVRDPDDMRHVTSEVTPGCEWVFTDDVRRPTHKFDGTCVMFDGQDWFARREVKAGKKIPPNFQLVNFDFNTGKKMGWEPIEQSSFFKFWQEAVEPWDHDQFEPGTYELIGPRINGGRDLPADAPHVLRMHAQAPVFTIEPEQYTFEGLREVVLRLLEVNNIEGIVWHHPDGRMAKLKGKDFS